MSSNSLPGSCQSRKSCTRSPSGMTPSVAALPSWRLKTARCENVPLPPRLEVSSATPSAGGTPSTSTLSIVESQSLSVGCDAAPAVAGGPSYTPEVKVTGASNTPVTTAPSNWSRVGVVGSATAGLAGTTDSGWPHPASEATIRPMMTAPKGAASRRAFLCFMSADVAAAAAARKAQFAAHPTARACAAVSGGAPASVAPVPRRAGRRRSRCRTGEPLRARS